ncbi:hypothetical protein ACHAXS_005529 [Conticribra weissflogii]
MYRRETMDYPVHDKSRTGCVIIVANFPIM